MPRMMLCVNQNGCNGTGEDCDHGVVHEELERCSHPTRSPECPDCVEVKLNKETNLYEEVENDT